MFLNHSGLNSNRRLDRSTTCGQLIWNYVRSNVILFGLVTLCLVATASSNAEENKSKLAITNIEDVDEDFRYMGEYQGMVRDANGCHQQAGLQIIALGDGQFGGMYYANGLPGTGWDRQHREPLKGKREGALLSLSSAASQKRVELVNGRPTIYDGGRIIGELKKVHRKSPTLGMPAPPNALTLFDGHDTNAFKNGRMTEDGLLIEGTELLSRFRDFTMHAEFCLPYMPHARGQGRSNSGFYLQSSYEVQVLDSFGLEGIENECGALYRYRRPSQNMCLPPLQWQTYDITFRSPRFDALGNKVCNGRITVLHNGVAVHDNFEIQRKTGAGKPESAMLRPIKFQDHSNPVRYRNIWLIDLRPADNVFVTNESVTRSGESKESLPVPN